MRTLRLVLITVVGLVVLTGLALTGAIWWSLPPSSDFARIRTLSAPVRIVLDADGIPHVLADTFRDAAAGLGYVHARDRMFQMDLMRRAASGRLSEIVGPAAIRLDRLSRTLGLRRHAEAELATLNPETRGLLDAYAEGVNAWIAGRGRWAAPEFVVLGQPEPWTPVDSLLWGRTMALYLSGNWRQELSNAALLRRLPPEQVRALWPAQPDTPAPDARLENAADRLLAAIPAFPEPFTLPQTASNEWAVDAAHSTTGAPLLAGDPHLAFGFPAIWYLVRIQTREGVLAGATAPGLPFLVLGHNGRIAWTFTTTGADTEDVFIETPLPGDKYATDDGPQPFVRHEERIGIRGAPDQVLSVRETRHGPVVSDLDPEPDGPVLAVAMAALAPGGSAADGLQALNRAATVAEAGAAAPGIVAPVQNLLVAGHDGIGQFTTGRIPIRKAGDGLFPVSGADGAHDWTGFASGDALPHQLNPASGHLVNANERTAPPDFPVFMGQDWFGDWRAQRIRTLLDTRSTHSLASFSAMQVDATSTFAQTVLPRLLRTPARDQQSRRALTTLGRWDGTMAVERNQPLLFNAWMRGFAAALRHRDNQPARGASDDIIARALGPEEATWCGPSCNDMLSTTLSEAAAATAGAMWGDRHRAVFSHPLLGRVPWLGTWFDFSIDQPGDDTTLFRGSPGPDGWTSVHGPEFRGIYDLADLDRSLFALAPGESGHPLRVNAGNLLARWRQGTSIRLGPAVQASETIELTP